MSIAFSLADALRWTRGRLLRAANPERTLSGASIDTRTLERGQLFVAIRGERHDAHAFLDRAVEAGAAALMVDETWAGARSSPPSVATLVVADTTRALGDLAAGHRAGFSGPVLAITGSSGKTTTKEMCHAILSCEAPCLKNRGNLNNAFGLPLSLLDREADQRSAVLEMGMNHRGEIALLASIARPQIGVLTNVGTAHIEFLGDRETIAEEKGDLLAALPEDGTAILNCDDPLVLSQRERARCRSLDFGLSPQAEISARNIHFAADEGYRFTLQTPLGEQALRVPGLAETTVINALAAAAAALAAGASLQSIARGLAAYEGVAGRMARRAIHAGAQLIDDTYNANPQSMRSALESLARLKGGGRAIAVLGDMGELGERAQAAHGEAGRLAAELGTDMLFALGENARELVRAAVDAGLCASSTHVAQGHEEIAAEIRAQLRPGDWVLVKGSRAMRMERVVEALMSGEKT